MPPASVEMIKPPQLWRSKASAAATSIDEDAIARAEAALEALSDQFDDWMFAEMERIDRARQVARAAGYSEATLEELFLCAHDSKGLGGMYQYPLVTRIAGSLSRMLETEETRAIAKESAPIVEAHVDALRALIRDMVKTDDHPTASRLAAALEEHVTALIGPPAP